VVLYAGEREQMGRELVPVLVPLAHAP
jgi:hypothetical protein